MSLLDLIMAAEAAQGQKAVRRTAYRHQHLADRPLVVVAYNLSGEAAAPLGIMYGVAGDPARATLVVAAEPRNRDSRFGAINAFAADFVKFITPYLALKTEPKKDGGFRQVAPGAPQIVTPNRATRSYLGARLGRSLRYLGLGDTHDVPEATKWTGSHLSWLAEHSQLPGQSTFLAMTESLSQHFVTGQSPLEDESLATLLAWIDGVDGEMLSALEAVEESAYGPVPDPQWEARLEPFVKAYSVGLRTGNKDAAQRSFNRVEREVRTALSVAYAATHRAVDIFRSLEPAASVTARWETDVREWSDHASRCTAGIPRFARRHDALRAARTLQRWSAAAEALEVDQAFDDPLVMARLDAEGRCVTGTITSVDRDNREVKPGQVTRTKVPLIELKLTAPTRLLGGEVVRWTADRKVKGVLRNVGTMAMTVAVTGGIKTFDTAGLAAGSDAMFVGLDPWEGMSPWTPDDVPWTHRPTTSELTEGDDDATADSDDSPDLALAELGEIPVLGTVGPENEPGVVL